MFSKSKRVRICEKYVIMLEGWFKGWFEGGRERGRRGVCDVGGRNYTYVTARISKRVNYHFAQSSGTYS